jgi:glycosyltransferase involved in cell wall biosynthesis
MPTKEKAMTIAFVHESESTFVVQDLEILRSFASVIDARFTTPLDAIRLTTAIAKSRIVYVWFATGRAATLALVLGKMLRKKVVSVAGGSEVSSQPAIRGVGRRARLRFFFTKIILETADCVLCVSNFTREEVLRNSTPRRCVVVHNAIDADKFKRTRKGEIVITVAVGKWSTKGIDRFVQLASNLPHRRFVVVGNVAREMPSDTVRPKNIDFIGELSSTRLAPIYGEARFYCQLSRYESFGVALAESMLAECVPIASDAGALPEIVGDAGFVVSHGDPVEVAKIIDEYWSQNETLGRRARTRIETAYSIDRRTNGLRSLLKEIGEN